MITPWKKIKEEYQGKQIMKTFRLPDGSIKEFPVRDEGKTTGVLAITHEEKVLLIRQFRPGPELIVSELPGGYVDGDETPEEAVKRELLEETGYIGTFDLVSVSLTSAYSNELLHNFVATDCRKIAEPHLDPSEFLEVIEMTIDEFKIHLHKGMMSNLETAYMGLHHLGLL